MTTNLFGPDPREKRGDVRKIRSAHLGAPIVEVRNRGAAGSRGRTAETRGSATSTIGAWGPARTSAEHIQELVSHRIGLRALVNELDLELYNLQPTYDSLKASFYAAHEALAWEWADRNDHSAEARARRRPLYDARMEAGCAWHPTRVKHDHLHAVRKALVAELRNISLELEE